MRYRYVAFDLDGTLLDSEDAVLLSLRDALRCVTGQEFSTEELVPSLGIPGIDFLAGLGLSDPEGALRVWEEHVLDYIDRVTLFPGVPRMLEALTRAGCRLGVVTSKTADEMEADFVPLGLGPWFPIQISASDTEEHKPQPGPLRAFMERAGARPEETLYVGDSPYDGECAHRAGVDFALAGWGCRGREVPAEHVLQSPEELLPLILK